MNNSKEDLVDQIESTEDRAKHCFNPKGVGGVQKCPLDTDKACIPSIFIKTSNFFLVKAVWCQLFPIFF